MRTNAFLILIVLVLSALTVSAQSSKDLVLEKGVATHKGLDDVYRRFSEGYRKLDAASVAALYTESAAYLAPGAEIQIGGPKILEIFSGFFDSVRKQNGKLEILFRIVQRQVDKNMAYDVGIYTLVSITEKGETRRSSGKFVVVATRGKDDAWRFQVDGYSDLPKVQNTSSISAQELENWNAVLLGGTLETN